MAGPLFRELAEDLSKNFTHKSELYTGHPDTLEHINSFEMLNITKSPLYYRKSKLTRIFSWLKYTFLAFFKVLFAQKGTLIFIVSNPPLLGPLLGLLAKLENSPMLY